MALSKKKKYPRVCKQGKTYIDVWGFKDSNGVYYDLSDYTARIEIRTQLPTEDSVAGDDDVLVTLTTENGGITITGGVVRIEIDAETTATFPVASYFWELEMIKNNGYIPTLMEPSSFKVTQENTLNA